MNIIDGLRKVKPALARQDIVLEFKHFLIKDGFIYAQDGRISAAAPIGADLGHFLIPAAELEKVMNLLSTAEDVTVKVTEKNLLLSAKGYKARIKILEPQLFVVPEGNETTQYITDDSFVNALQRVRPFISENALNIWAAGAYIDGCKVYATNNICLVVADIVPFKFTGMIPVWAVDFILARPERIHSIRGSENSLRVEWNDGSWMRTNLINSKFPEKGIDMLQSAPEASFKLTEAWKKSYREAALFTEGSIEIYSDKIRGVKENMDLEVEAISPVPDIISGECSRWNPKFLNDVINAAEAFDCNIWPAPATFSGKNFRGFVVGLR